MERSAYKRRFGLDRERPVGVFDSGLGGLGVLRAICRLLPLERILYFGDTLRAPYGNRSDEAILDYAIEASEHLVRRGVKALVVACGTMSSVALSELRRRWAPISVIGTVAPGARAAVAAAKGPRGSARFLVLGTEVTVRHQAFTREIRDLDPTCIVEELACPQFVELVERGCVQGSAAEQTVARRLRPLAERPAAELPTSVILGCTHFPHLRTSIERALGRPLVDPAAATAEELRRELARTNLFRSSPSGGCLHLLASGCARHFASVGSTLLGVALAPADIAVIRSNGVDVGLEPPLKIENLRSEDGRMGS